MPYRLCPNCRVRGRLLEQTSKDALVEYYRCDKCGHVWTHDKRDPERIEHITELPPERSAKRSR